MDRRTLLLRIAAVASAAYWSGDTLAVELAKASSARDAVPAPVVLLPAPLGACLSAACELIIPKTDTPGALEAGVPAFIADMYAHWMTPVERETMAGGLAALDAAARAAHGLAFAACSTVQQGALLTASRQTAAAYVAHGYGARIADPAAPFFYKLRDLVTLGYFTSEQGIAKELAYVPVPGRFDGDIDINTWNRQMEL